MDINLEKGTIIIFGKSSKLDTMVAKFSSLSGEQVYSFFTNRGIQLPRRINVLALYSVLNDRIKWINSNTLAKDYFMRLKYYSHFTEHQLYNLFLSICNDDNAFALYRKNLFRLILINFVALDLKDGELNYVKTLKKAKTEPFEQYFNFVSGACLEQDDTFDGVNTDELREYLPLSASNQEIVDLASKYGIDLPTRLSKEQYAAYIYDQMRQNNTYSPEIQEELDKMSLQQLVTYAKRTNINMEPQMSKEQLVIYLFWYLEQCTISKTTVRRVENEEFYNPLSFEVDLGQINIFGNGRGKRLIKYDGMYEDTKKWEAIQDGTYNKPEEKVIEEVDDTPIVVEKTPVIEEKKEEVVYQKEEFKKAHYEEYNDQEINSGLDATTIHGDENTLDSIVNDIKESKEESRLKRPDDIKPLFEKKEEEKPEEKALENKPLVKEPEDLKPAYEKEVQLQPKTDPVPNREPIKKEEPEEVKKESHGLLVEEDFASTQVEENDKYGSDAILGIDKNEGVKIFLSILALIIVLAGVGFLVYYFFLKDKMF